MSTTSQQTNMKRLAELLERDLGYIFGERESGPNGAKKLFLSKGRAFLSALGQDLSFAEQKTTVNPAGIAMSGSVTVMGMWHEKNGLYICIEEPCFGDFCILYRDIRHMKDHSGGRNRWISRTQLAGGDYKAFLAIFLRMKEAAAYGNAA